MAYQLAYVGLALLAGVAAYWLALRKGRSPRLWMIASVFFAFPLLVLAILPSQNLAERS